MAGSIILLLCIVACAFTFLRSCSGPVNRFTMFRTALYNLDSDESQFHSLEIKNIYKVCREFLGHVKFVTLLVVVVMVASLPLYVLRLLDNEHNYSSHWNTYSWTFSFSHLDGKLMGALLLVVWSLAFVTFFIRVTFSWFAPHASYTTTVTTSSEGRTVWNLNVLIALVGVVCVTLLVNVLYILSTTELSLSPAASFVIRLAVSLYRIVSSALLVPFLVSPVKNVERKSLLMFRLLLLNNILIPCAVTALTSPNCFQVYSC